MVRLVEHGCGCDGCKFRAREAAIPVGDEDEVKRTFSTGATRDTDTGKLHYRRFRSAIADKRYAEFMHENRKMKDGSMREPDNWKLGIAREVYADSMERHVADLKLHLEGYPEQAVDKDFEKVLCAILFNVHGLLHEAVKARIKAGTIESSPPSAVETPTDARAEFKHHDSNCRWWTWKPCNCSGSACFVGCSH